MQKNLSAKLERSELLIEYLQTNVVDKIEMIVSDMVDMRVQLNRIIDDDISIPLAEQLLAYEAKKITRENLFAWSTTSSESLQCILENSKSTSRLKCSQAIEIASSYFIFDQITASVATGTATPTSKGVSLAFAPSFLRADTQVFRRSTAIGRNEIQSSSSLLLLQQQQQRPSIFRNSQTSQTIQTRNNSDLKELLLKSKNVQKSIHSQEQFQRESLPKVDLILTSDLDPSTQSNQAVLPSYLGTETSWEEKEQVLSLKYETNILDLENRFEETLRSNFSGKVFAQIVFAFQILSINSNSEFDRDDKTSMADLFSELLAIPSEESTVLRAIAQNQFSNVLLKGIVDRDNSNANQEEGSSLLSSTLKSIVTLIQSVKIPGIIQSGVEGGEEGVSAAAQLAKSNSNVLLQLLSKIVHCPVESSVVVKHEVFMQDLLKQVLLLVAMNNQWKVALKEGDESTREGIQGTFEKLAKIFFCGSISFEDILLNLNEVDAKIDIPPITFPLTFQIMRLLLQSLLVSNQSDSSLHTSNQSLHVHWMDAFECLQRFVVNNLSLSKDTLQLAFINECLKERIQSLKRSNPKAALSCLKEIEHLKFAREQASTTILTQIEIDIQKQLAEGLLVEFVDIANSIHSYLNASNAGVAIEKFVEVFIFVLGFTTDNNLIEQKKRVASYFSIAAKNLCFALTSRFITASSSNKPKFQSVVAMTSTDSESESIVVLESNQLAENQNNSTDGSQILVATVNESQIQEDSYELRLLTNLKELLAHFNSEDNYGLIFNVYAAHFEKAFECATTREFAKIFFDNLVQDIFESIKILSNRKHNLNCSAMPTVLSLCIELLKLEKILSFSDEVSCFEIALPLFMLWMDDYKVKQTKAVEECLEKERWELQACGPNKIADANSQNSIEFVAIIIKSYEELVKMTSGFSYDFTKLVKSLAETVLLDSCEFYCSMNVSSLDELERNLVETEFTAIDQFHEEYLLEDQQSQENNLNILRSICLRLGNLRYLFREINQNSHLKNANVLELLNDSINFASKKLAEIIGHSFTQIQLRNFFDCYLRQINNIHLNTYSPIVFTQKSADCAGVLLQRYKVYFNMLKQRSPKLFLEVIEKIIVVDFEKELVVCFTDINRLETVQNHKKLGLLFQHEIDYILNFLRLNLTSAVQFREVQKIGILFQKDTSDLIMQTENVQIPENDCCLAFRIIFMRRKHEKVAREYTNKHQHKFMLKKTFNVKQFLLFH